MRSAIGLLLLVTACGDDSSSGVDEGSTTDAMMSSDTSTSTTGDAEADTTSMEASEGSSDEGFEPPDAECGNGFVEGDEECDDANEDEGDGCTSQCQVRCGLDWSVEILPPTDQSEVDAVGVVADSGGGAVVAGSVREITTDQRGNETVLDDASFVRRLSPEGEELWAIDLAEAGFDITVAGVAIDDANDVYVVASVRVVGEDRDIRLYKFESGGRELWSVDVDSAVDTAEDVPFAVTVGADGNPLVSGQLRIGEGDDDVWVGSFAASDGAEVWTSTWSGTPNGGFSIDQGGPMAVADDGTVYVFAREYVDFETNVAVLLAFGSEGGDAQVIYRTDFGGGGQTQNPSSVAVSGDGVYVAFERFLPTANEFYVRRIDPTDGSELMSVEAATFVDASGLRGAQSAAIVGVDTLASGYVVTGTLVREEIEAFWVESWIARFDDGDGLECMFVRESPPTSLIPGSLRARDLSSATSGRAIMSAVEEQDGVESLWFGAFRPPE